MKFKLQSVLLVTLSVLSLSFNINPVANAHSLATNASVTISVGESTTLTNMTGGCDSKCTFSYSLGGWTGTYSLVSSGLNITAPSVLNAASATYSIILSANKSSGDTYVTTWAVTVLDPNYPYVVNYVVNCDATTNGGDPVSPSSFNYTAGQPGVTCPTPNSRVGYNFSGWFTAPSGGSAASFPYIATSNVTFYAQWTQVISPSGGTNPGSAGTLITVICDAVTNGGNEVNPNTYTFLYGQTGVTCPEPAPRPGYSFNGWFTDPTGGTVISFPYAPGANRTVYAQWTPSAYTVTCDAVTNGGTAVSPSTFTYTSGQTGITCPTPSARPGFNFNGYFTSAAGGSSISFPYTPSGNTTLYAQWTPSAYTVTCDAVTNGGTAVSPSTFTYTSGQTGITCPTPSARPGFNFNGYFTSAAGGSSISFPYTPSGNTTVYAQWDAVLSTQVTADPVVVYFAWDSNSLTPKAKETLKKFVESLPEGVTNLSMDITGYAQIARSASYDLKLSRNRANAISKYLQSLGIDAEVTIIARGWDDKTAKSRRGEVVATYTLTQP